MKLMETRDYSNDLAIAASQNKQDRDYWLNQFSGQLVKSCFPFDYEKKGAKQPYRDAVKFLFSEELSAKLRRVSNHSDHVLHIILVSGLVVLLNKYTGHKDIIIGTPIYKQEIAGKFINTVLALRSRIEDNMTFKELLSQVRQSIVEADAHQNYPIEILLKDLNLPSHTSEFPLFDLAVFLESIHDKSDIQHINLKMIFSFKSTAENVNGELDYHTSWYEKSTIERIVSHFTRLMQECLSHLNAELSSIEILSEDEKKLLLFCFNNTRSEYHGERTIQKLFEEQAARTPDHVTVVFEDMNLTYGELNANANRFACLLRKKGVRPDTIVGVMLERSLQMMVGIFAVLKAGGAYLPIDPELPKKRVTSMLADCQAALLITKIIAVQAHSYTTLQGQTLSRFKPEVSAPRQRITNMDSLPMPDRWLLNYEKYSQYLGYAGIKNSISLEVTRGCPFSCSYCYKIFPNQQVSCSAENIFSEIHYYYNLGVRRFSIVDDIFNLDIKNSARLFHLIIKNGLKIQLFFSAGLRGDILTKEYIDLMVEAGTVSLAPALETASPRLQKLIRKNLHLEKLRENLEYICEKYPNVILELFIMHGFPTETEEEAKMTLDFVKGIKGIHFPYINILRIYANTDMAKFAVKNGVAYDDIISSEDLAWHELPETLPFTRSFTLKYQTEFLNDYFLSKERLLHVLPYQIKLLSQDELVQKYNSYLPVDINCFDQLLQFLKIKKTELGAADFTEDNYTPISRLFSHEKREKNSPTRKLCQGALKILLLDLNLFFSHESDMLYDLVDEPLGLIRLLTYLNRELGSKINGKIAKSRIDFDSYTELKALLKKFTPHVIGIRTLTFYRDFFHQTVALIRDWGIDVPIIAGGPHATSNYPAILQDQNVNLAVIGEGEITLTELVTEMIQNRGKLPDETILKKIPGIAFIPQSEKTRLKSNRKILLWDGLMASVSNESPGNLNHINQPQDLAYAIYTSGSSGKPKGVSVQHKNVVAYLHAFYQEFNISEKDIVIQQASYSFDTFVEEVYPVILRGGKLIIPKKNHVMDVNLFRKFLVRSNVNIISASPLLLNELNKLEPINCIHTFISGGDALKIEYIDNLLQVGQVYNTYGPTESTVCASYYKCNNNFKSNVPIGKPIANYKLYILDKNKKLLPIGIPGELFICGPGVTRGYLNNAELTAEKFERAVIDHSSFVTGSSKSSTNNQWPITNDRFYRTGDLAKWLLDGDIDFLGRLDQQVKIRGYRIELGEIESQLRQHKNITAALVLTNELNTGPAANQCQDKSLCAYLVSNSDFSVSEIREFLLKKLPGYMIPAYFVRIDSIPITPNGKIDRKALPAPRVKTGGEYAAPRDETEKKLVEIWSEVIGIEKDIISIDTNFFELGGHSLKAIELSARVHKELNVNVMLAEIFKTPTVRGLAEFIKGEKENSYISIEPVEKKEYYVLSSAQKRLYILQQLVPDSTAYNIPQIIHLDKSIEPEKLEKVLKRLPDRHESLRTTFHMLESQPVQKVHEELEFEIEFHETTEDRGQNTEGKADTHLSSIIRHLSSGFIRPFDLSRGPLLRVGLIKLLHTPSALRGHPSQEGKGNKYLLLVDMHHIISDGVSQEILVKDFMALHQGDDLSPLKIQYKDFSQWQDSEKEKENIKHQKAYWLNEFGIQAEIPVLNMTTDYVRPAFQDFAGSVVSFKMPSTVTNAIKRLALENGATLYIVLLAVINVLLSKLSRQEDIVIGSPVAGRRHADLEKIIGMFVNTLALRNFPKADKPFIHFLREITARTLAAFENQDYPFEDLVDRVEVKRDTGRNPLFDIMFVLQNFDDASSPISPIPAEEDIPGPESGQYRFENNIAKFDITFSAVETGTNLLFSVQYCTKLFKKKTIQRFIGYLQTIVSKILPDTNQKISGIEIISLKEKAQILNEFNNTARDYPQNKTIHQLVEEQVENRPDHIAIVGTTPGTQCTAQRSARHHLTYRELNQRSNQLAGLLQEKGLKPNTIVGIRLQRSIHMVIAILAVLKSGGTYLPIDPNYPQKRQEYMLADCAAKLIIARGSDIGQHIKNGNIINVDIEDNHLFKKDLNIENPEVNVTPESLIYTIFTSGSTGRPKGAGVYHKGFMNLMNWYMKEFILLPGDSVLLLTSLSFDLTQKNLFAPLAVGGTLHIPTVNYYDPGEILREVCLNKLTRLNCTPGMFYKLVEEEDELAKLTSLRYVFLGGEPISVPMLMKWLESSYCHAEMVNTYGPTECTDVCSFYRITHPKLHLSQSVPIGQPVDNTQLFVLDRHLHLVPTGVVGELCIGGAGVGTGYINHIEMTSEKFITISFDMGPERPVYRTGDLVKQHGNGNIEFIARMDQQVKIRGYRIELEEIENQLLKHSAVKKAVVLARGNESSDKYLCAYIVPDISAVFDTTPLLYGELKKYLSHSLPDYMVPPYFVKIEKLPLNPNGKIDRDALPEPEVNAGDTYTEPRNKLEKKLAEIWSEVIGIEKDIISINANFFELGGHSLRATLLASKVHKALDVQLPLAEIFKTPTISGLAGYITGCKQDKHSAIEPVENKEYYPLNSAQQRLYILQQMDLGSTAYNIPEFLSLEETLELEELEEIFKRMIHRHESLRTTYHMIHDEPVQKVHKAHEVEFAIEYHDRWNLGSGQQGSGKSRGPDSPYPPPGTDVILYHFTRPFDLSRAPLLRIGMIKTGKGKGLLMFDLHHIAADGSSCEILGREFKAICSGEKLHPLRIQHKDFAEWQKGEKQKELVKKQESYWLKEFSDEIPVFNLPTDSPRPLMQGYEGNWVRFALSAEETKIIKDIARTNDVTLFMCLLVLFNILFSKLSSQEDIILGTPIAARRHADLQYIIGMLANTLVLRNYPSSEKPLKVFLREVKQRTLDAYDNQEYPFEDLVEKIFVNRDTSRNPIFDVMLNLLSQWTSTGTTGDSQEIKDRPPYQHQKGTSRFDITFSALDQGERICFGLEYSTRLFTPSTIERFIRYLKTIVHSLPRNMERKLSDIEFIPTEEKQEILQICSGFEELYNSGETIHHLFEEQVEREPERTALVGSLYGTQSSELHHLSYQELNKSANQLAVHLRRKGIHSNRIVAIIVEQSIDMLIAILAVLKAGGAYLPIDSNYPRERIMYILEDSSSALILTQQHLASKAMNSCEIIDLEDTGLYKGDASNLEGVNGSTDLVYVIYTSGSTGKPKGTLIRHQSLNNLCHWHNKRYSVTHSDRATKYAGFGFDASVWEIFPYLISGAAIYIIEPEMKLDIYRLNGFFEKNKITIAFLPTQVCEQFMTLQNHSLRVLLTGGDKLKRFTRQNYQLVNNYGPTENTVVSTSFTVDGIYGDIPIGKPIDNTKLFVLSKQQQLQPIGVAGELSISGVGLAAGYLNRPELTAGKFVPAHSSWLIADREEKQVTNQSPMPYIFKTGDLVRWRPDGNIEFLGRMDHQVKIRGYRIELGEIEIHLMNHQYIKDAVVIAVDSPGGNSFVQESQDKFLSAYIVSARELPPLEIKAYLAKQLPDYMIPSYFMKLEKIPLNPNGKIDRNALPAPEIKTLVEYAAPRHAVEETLVRLWSEVLNIDPENVTIGIDDNFFELGGHSLKATILVSKIQQALDVQLSLAEIFRTPTIRKLAQYIDLAAENRYTSIKAVEKRNYYHLSSVQQRLYILQLMDLENVVYNLPEVIPLPEEIDFGNLKETFIKLIERHESLRTSFHMKENEPVQKIHDKVEFEIEYYETTGDMGLKTDDRRKNTEGKADTHMSSVIRHLLSRFIRPFDLSQAPLLRLGVIQTHSTPSVSVSTTTPTTHQRESIGSRNLLLVDMHHIISDGISHRILDRDFMKLNDREELPPLRIQYKDFSQWQNREKESGTFKAQEAYWLKEFPEDVPLLELPMDFVRPAIQNFEGSTLSFEISPQESSALAKMALTNGSTLYMMLLAIFNILLSKLSSQEDIVVGTPVAGRRHADLLQIMGMFVNTLAMRNYPQNEKTFVEFLSDIKKRTLQAFENQDYPFEELVEKATLKRDASRNPFFDVMFVLQNMGNIEDKPGEISPGEPGQMFPDFETGISKFDITLIGVDAAENLVFSFEYCTKLFKKQTIERFINYFKKIVSSVAADPRQKISAIETISGEEKKQVLYDFNDTGAEYPKDKTIHELFAEQVGQTPGQIALVGQNVNPRFQIPNKGEPPGQVLFTFNGGHLSYKELNEKAEQLAALLIDKGIRPDTIVGIMVERSMEMMVGILGILKAGGAYLPIDPDYPEERKQYILKDSGVKILLTCQEIAVLSWPEAYNNSPKDTPSFGIWNFLLAKNTTPPGSSPRQEGHLAYVIYTSGTTGKPKGVLVEHKNVVRLLFNDRFPFDFDDRDVWTLFHSYCFDFSVWEMYGALLYGGKLIVIPQMVTRDPHLYLEILKKERVTILNQIPSVFYHIIDEELKYREPELGLRYVIFGGEALNPGKLQEWKEKYPGTRLVNMYGITETTVHVTYKEITGTDIRTGRSNIGKPIPTLTAYVMDKHLRLLPPGVPGEICVGGKGVSRGYLNRPGLTREKFVPNPFRSDECLYRSGDLARWVDGEGNMEYMGRIDHQVKIRGFRIELGEIECQLLKYDKINEAVVVVKADETKDKHLCAYIVPAKEFSVSQLRGFLSGKLPDYMIPNYFVPLEHIPLTPNGKIDRKSLPEPRTAMATGAYVPPQDDIEEKLVHIWSEVLAIEETKISTNANFFQLGGHSLKATIMISKIHKELQVRIPLAEVFKTPSIRALAANIKLTKKERFVAIDPMEKKEYYLLSPAQKRLFFLQQLVPGTTGYNIINVIRLTENIDSARLELIFKGLLTRHESLRTSFEMIAEEPVQRIHKEVNFSIDCYDSVETETESFTANFIRPFDLDHAPLLRVGLVNIEKSRQILLVDMHHIITDGTSQSILEKEFMRLYWGENLAPLRLQYRDFAQWQHRSQWKELTGEQEAYWLKEFSGELPVLHLPSDYPRPLMQSFDGNHLEFALNVEEVNILKTTARENNITLYMCLLAVFNVLFSKLSGDEDIVLGTPIAARRHADLQHVVGMMVNTLAMRNYPSADKPFKKFLKEVKQQTLGAYENQEYPFEILVDDILPTRDTSRNPVFDVMFNLMNQADYPGSVNSSNIEALTSYSYRHTTGTSRFDIVFSAVDREEYIYFMVEYSSRLFAPTTIDRYINYFRNIVTYLPGNTDSLLAQLPMISEKEKNEILGRLSGGIEEMDKADKTITRLFEEQVEKTPNHIAVIDPSLGYISYDKLNRKSNRLAYLLREKGIGPNSAVGLMIERSIEMIIGILAILKAGGAYLPIDPQYPQQRIETMLNDGGTTILLTKSKELASFSITGLKNMKARNENIVVTLARDQITNFDRLPIPDRTLIDYKKYHQYIGEAPAKHTITLQATRGCPYHCLYCHKIWPKKHVTRSAGNIFKEISYAYEAGIRRFVFIDDIFNLDRKNAARFLETTIKSEMDIQLFFPNGFRADILSRDFIDLMAAAGTVNLDVALESASPRIQKLIRKNLNLEKFKENVQYITETYPQIILEMELMLGFPTESQEEAMMTLDFLESLKWVHFPNLHILKIFPNTDICTLAIENGISIEAIERSANLAFHELPDTLPFSKSFTRQLQAKFMGEYFLSKKRLLHVLPFQMKILSEDELIQKYDSYLSSEIKHFDDILRYTGISREELGYGDVRLMQEEQFQALDFVQKISKYFPVKNNIAPGGVFRILFLDLSQLFSEEHEYMLHHQIEEPLGLLYLMTYLNETFKDRIHGKIFKSRIDFDSYEELKTIIFDFKPDLIGIRTLSFYKQFFHKAVLMIRQWGMDVPIVAGGPYATSDYQLILQDPHVDVVVLGEGEFTLAHLVEKIMENNKQLPGEEVLQDLHGIAFRSRGNQGNLEEKTRDLLLPDEIPGRLKRYHTANPGPINQADDLLYVLYTSGSTGTPKGVMLEHGNLVNLIRYQYDHTDIDFGRVLQFTTIGFDVSAQEIFSTLLAGGRLYLVAKDTLADIPELFKMVEKSYIKTLFLPTSFLKFVINEEEFLRLLPASVKHIVTAGEQMMVNERFNRYLKENDVFFHNHYGPSETHVVTTFTVKPGGDTAELPPIGRPVLNTWIYLLDKGCKPVPMGVSGELFIGGIQVGRGYLNNPELTSERFINYQLQNTNYNVQNYKTNGIHAILQSCIHASMQYYSPSPQYPIPPLPHLPIYKTGDLARWLADSNIEFLGRIDHQVKVRGFRVELGEIESRLINHPGIKDVVVQARAAETGEKYLCAYIVAHDIEFSVSGLREYVSTQLPEYMIPSYFVRMDQLPLTPNRKIDRRRLPEPALEDGGEHIAPRNEIEQKMVQIWAETLELDKSSISIDSNFFELGGHSLRAAVMTAKIHKKLNVKLPLAEVFNTPTIRGLSEYINGLTEHKFLSIGPAEEKEYYRLSSAQKRLYILKDMDDQSINYNLPYAAILEGKADKRKLEDTFKSLIKRHESLRTSFHMITDEPVQKIHKYNEVGFGIEYYEAERQASRAGRKENRLAPHAVRCASIVKAFIRPFDLAQAPLLRVCLLHHPFIEPAVPSQVEKVNNRHILIIDMHHIISDGVSMGLLVREFMLSYGGEKLQDLRLQYKDFSEWQCSQVIKETVKKQEEYWLNEFEGEIPLLDLPMDFKRPIIQSFEGGTSSFGIEKKDTAALKKHALKEKTTLFTVLLAAYNIFLSKISSQEDIVVGTPVAGRQHSDMEYIVGMFVNTLPLRNFPAGEKTFNQFLVEVKEKSLEAFANQDYQYEDLVEKTVTNRDAGRNPLFDTMFSWQNFDIPIIDIPGLNLKPYSFELEITRFDLIFRSIEIEDRLECTFNYSKKLFNLLTIERFSGHFKKVISAIIESPPVKISDIEIISEDEKRQILYGFNDTGAEYPKDMTIQQLFEEQVEKTPDNIAVAAIENDSWREGHRVRIRYITYIELKTRTNQLAWILKSKGIGAGSIVTIITEPTVNIIIGILAILKTGSCYLPLSPRNPENRITYILKDSETRLLLTQPGLLTPMSIGVEVLYIDNDSLYKKTGENFPDNICKPCDPIYMIYTSGTTGKPKGVLIKHENLVNYVTWFSRETGLTNEDRTVLTSSFAFDLGYTSLYSSVLRGGQLHLLPREIYMVPELFLDYIHRHRLTYIKVTPSFFNMMAANPDFSNKSCEMLRLVVLGGEAINVEDVQKMHYICPHIKVMNHYGPTEVTIGSIATFIDFHRFDQYKARPTIGRPISNTKAFIVDKYFKLLPVGIAGELCLSGAGVAKGYFKRDQLNSERFISNAFMGEGAVIKPYETVYRTGDLARWMLDGNIEFLGRIDSQVKIRGFRIELGEIESQLLNHPGIKEAVVIIRAIQNQGNYLCAYINSIKKMTAQELREYLSKRLPDYMVPSYFVFLKSIPLTPNGKLDRKALPDPGWKAGDEYRAPGNEMEKKLVDIWSKVLKIPGDIISIESNFFELGGHSLKATIFITQVNRELNIRLPLTEVFKTPTIRQLAEYIRNESREGLSCTDPYLVLLKRKSRNAQHLFFIHDGSGEVEGYGEFCSHLNIDFNCWGIRADVIKNYTPNNASIEEIAGKYLEKIKKVQPQGPYYLAGWSLGGTIAFETVSQLEIMGENIYFLAVIDSPGPQGNRIEEQIQFNLESEIHWVCQYLPDEVIKEKVRNLNDINELWPIILDHLVENHLSVEIIKRLIPGQLAQIIPNYNQLKIKELVYYMNLNRTLTYARRFFIPSRKIHTTLYYFKASQSLAAQDSWNDYCLKPIKSYEVPGDHFSIFKAPNVVRSAKIVEKVLNNCCNCISRD
jgi:amino acid adenylation domain-containing protein